MEMLILGIRPKRSFGAAVEPRAVVWVGEVTADMQVFTTFHQLIVDVINILGESVNLFAVNLDAQNY